MTHPTAVPRLALWKTLSVAAIAAAALLAFTGAARAAVITVSPDGTAGTDNLRTAMTTANTNTDTSNTLILSPGKYTPSGTEPAITKNLVITGNHASQTITAAPVVNIAGANQASLSPGNLFAVNAGVNATMEAIQIISGGGSGFNQIDDSGNLTLWGVSLTGAPGAGITVEAGGTMAFNESTVGSMTQVGITNNGTLSVDTSDVVTGASSGIVNNGTETLHNALVIKDHPACVGTAATSGLGSMDDDSTCNVANHSTTVDGFFPLNPTHNGGPTETWEMNSGSPTENAGTACQTTDQRFFVNPGSGTSCDAGAVTRAAVRNTTAPTCTVTGGSAGPPATQQVTVQSPSGMGPESGLAGDPNASSTTVPQNPRSTASPNNPADAIDGLGIQNGSVAFTPFTAPSTGPLVLTATKATQTMLTHWWFTATDWAGNVTFCQ